MWKFNTDPLRANFCPGTDHHDILGYVSTVAECVRAAEAKGVNRICLSPTSTTGQYMCAAGLYNGDYSQTSPTPCNKPCPDGQCGGIESGSVYVSTYALGKSEQAHLHVGTSGASSGSMPSMPPMPPMPSMPTSVLQPTHLSVRQPTRYPLFCFLRHQGSQHRADHAVLERH